VRNQTEQGYMAKVSCKYFVNVLGATKKEREIVEVPDGMTVEQFLDFMAEKYGPEFARHVYATGTLSGEPYTKPNIYLNRGRLQSLQDEPDGVKTIVRDGDEIWFGLIFGGG
jgi:hypothetical protein